MLRDSAPNGWREYSCIPRIGRGEAGKVTQIHTVRRWRAQAVLKRGLSQPTDLLVPWTSEDRRTVNSVLGKGWSIQYVFTAVDWECEKSLQGDARNPQRIGSETRGRRCARNPAGVRSRPHRHRRLFAPLCHVGI